MEPRYLAYVVAALLLCGLLRIGDPREDRLRSGDGIRVSVVTYFCRGNPALCWQRSNRNVRLFLGSSIPGTYPSWKRKFLSLIICWKSKETIRDLYGFSCRTYHSLMVVTTVWMVAIVGISAECLCWLRLILYFRNDFYTMH